MSKLVRLYPEAWRARYGEEFGRLIDERPPTLADRLDILRGALDAQLHPHALVDGPEPAPWTHRIPGLLALSAGVAMTGAILSIAFGSGPDWGAAGSFFGGAVMLMLLSVPGDYLGPFGRRVGIALGALALCVTGANAFGWGIPSTLLAIGAVLIVSGGLLAMAGIRAGVAARGRWLLLASGVALPLVAIAAHALIRAVTGIVLVPDGSSIAALAILPYGLAWLLVGVRMTVRGSPTIVDPPADATPASEVQTA